MSVKIGVIGCGAIGRDHTRRLVHLVPNADVVAVSDYFHESAEQVAKEYNIEAIKDSHELIKRKDIDAIVICSSDSSHAEYVKAGLEADKFIFCEKPLAENSKDCLDIVEMELSKNRKLVQVGFMRRYDAGYREIKNYIDNGNLGSALLINAAHRNFTQPDGITTNMGITNVAIHEIDIFRWLLNEEYKAGKVFKVKQSRNSQGYDNPQLILLETISGIIINVEIQVNDAYAYDIQCQVICENGTVNLPEPAKAYTRQNATLQHPILTDWKDRFIEAYDVELTEWVSAVEEGVVLGPTSWDGYAACRTAEVLNKSRDSDALLEIDLIEKPSIYEN